MGGVVYCSGVYGVGLNWPGVYCEDGYCGEGY